MLTPKVKLLRFGSHAPVQQEPIKPPPGHTHLDHGFHGSCPSCQRDRQIRWKLQLAGAEAARASAVRARINRD